MLSDSSSRAPPPQSTVPILLEADWLIKCESTTTTATTPTNEDQPEQRDDNEMLNVHDEFIVSSTDASSTSDDDDFIEVTSTTLQLNNNNTNEHTPTNDYSQPSTSHEQYDDNTTPNAQEQQQQQMDSIQYEECQVDEFIKVFNSLYQQLLRLFGIPYVCALGEAEAQCARLEQCKCVQATVSDDSDVWLFGTLVTYRNLFNTQQHVHMYTQEAIRRTIGMCVGVNGTCQIVLQV
jgi:hypothetical protein